MKFKLVLFLLLLITLITSANADVIGQLIPLKGKPVIHGTPEIKVVSPTDLNINDIISTGNGVKAKIILKDKTLLLLKENTRLKIHKNFIKIKHGFTTLRYFKTGKKYKVFTPTSIMSIYGTTFTVSVSLDGNSVVSLIEGIIKVTALYGNKKNHILNPGEFVKSSKSGLSDIFKIESVLKGKLIKDDTTIKKPEEIQNEEEEILENLEMNGKFRCFIKIMKSKLPMTSFPWMIKINGYNRFNGMQLAYVGEKKVFINKLEPGSYDFTVLTSGSEYTFPYEINAETSGSTINLSIKRIFIKFSLGDSKKYLSNEELSKTIRIFITSGDKRNQIFFKFQKHENKSPGYQVGIRERNEIGISIPAEIELPLLVELYYDGDTVTSTKHIKIRPVDNQIFYEVKF